MVSTVIVGAFKGIGAGISRETAPAMLIMLLLGKRAPWGTAQSIGRVLWLMYILGRMSKPSDRIKIFTAGLVLFALGAMLNGICSMTWG